MDKLTLITLVLFTTFFACKNEKKIEQTSVSTQKVASRQHHQDTYKISDFVGLFQSKDGTLARVIKQSKGAHFQIIMGPDVYQRPFYEMNLQDNQLKFSHDYRKASLSIAEKNTISAIIDDHPEFDPTEVTLQRIDPNTDNYYITDFVKEFDQYFVQAQYFHVSYSMGEEVIVTDQPVKMELVFNKYPNLTGALISRDILMKDWKNNKDQAYNIQVVDNKVVQFYKM